MPKIMFNHPTQSFIVYLDDLLDHGGGATDSPHKEGHRLVHEIRLEFQIFIKD